jgi:hypothetical protein
MGVNRNNPGVHRCLATERCSRLGQSPPRSGRAHHTYRGSVCELAEGWGWIYRLVVGSLGLIVLVTVGGGMHVGREELPGHAHGHRLRRRGWPRGLPTPVGAKKAA